jgi:hypothetical protein
MVRLDTCQKVRLIFVKLSGSDPYAIAEYTYLIIC